jgi:hypothetical protein
MAVSFKKYLEIKRRTIADVARELGEHRETVRTWINGAIPRRQQMLKIYLWSKGQVQPNDFYELPNPGHVSELPLFSDSFSKNPVCKKIKKQNGG